MTTTTIDKTKLPVPTFKVGDQTIPGNNGGKVVRVDGQTVWLVECPSWCIGHEPAEQCDDLADFERAAGSWADIHLGETWELSPGRIEIGGRVRREAQPPVELSLERTSPMLAGDEWTEPVVDFWVLPNEYGAPRTQLTAPEARSLAAALIRMADKIEAGR